MRKQVFFAITAMATLFLVNGCQKPLADSPVLTLEATEYTIAAEGGKVSVPFELTNATEGAEVSVMPDAEYDWVKVASVGEAAVELSVAKNETEFQREAEFTVSYPGVSADIKFSVFQAAGEPAEVTFDISVHDITADSFTYEIVPSDKEMTYFHLYMAVSDLEELGVIADGVFDQEALYQICKMYYMSDPDYFEMLTAKGDLKDAYGAGLSAEVMRVFCFGVDPETLERLSDVFYTDFKMEALPATIDLDESEFNVGAGGYNGGTYYYTGGDFGEGAVTAVSDKDWVTVSVDEGEKYIAFTVAANDTPEARTATVTVSHPSVAEPAVLTINQEAGESVPEDANFEISVSNITAESFTYSIVPSDKEMTYFHLFMAKSDLEELGVVADGALDQEALYQLCKTYYMSDPDVLAMFTAKGDLKDAPGAGLSAEVMVVFCFGVDPATSERLSDVFYSEFKMEALPATIDLDESEFNVGAGGYNGGTYYYTGGDFGEGAVTAVSDKDWVTVSVDEDERYIAFKVAANDTSEARTATVTVSHPSVAEPVTITINQAAGE